MALDVDLGHAGDQTLLHFGHGLVVDARPDLFEEEVQQRPGSDVADLLAELFEVIALDRCDRAGARVLVQGDGDVGPPAWLGGTGVFICPGS